MTKQDLINDIQFNNNGTIQTGRILCLDSDPAATVWVAGVTDADADLSWHIARSQIIAVIAAF